MYSKKECITKRLPELRLRALQPQQLKYTLLKLELPRLLAPDFPFNWYSMSRLNCSHSDSDARKGNTSLFLVTTSQSLQWVIYAPAAFLRCASRFSGCLSGIEPWFPVTRYKHGSPIPNHRHLISQYFEWPTVAEAYGPLSSLDSSEDTKGDRFKERKNTSCDAFSKY